MIVEQPAQQAARERVRPEGLEEGLEAIRATQLASGEMVAYRREPAGRLQYVRSPLVSALVHDVLGCFDPRSPGWEERCVSSIANGARARFVWTAVRLRRRIRGYLVWQAEAEGGWRFYGRASGRPMDAITTAGAAVALLESPGRAARARRARHLEVIERLRSADGLYHTVVLPDGRGCGWWDERGRPVAGYDPAANAQVLRLLALTGARPPGELAPLVRYLREQVAAPPPLVGLFADPLCLYHLVARAWSQAALPDLDGLAADLVPRVLVRQDDTGGFGGPLCTALAVSVLLDLGYEGEELERGLAAVARGRLRWGGWGHDEFLAGGHGSLAWTTALSIAALARGTSRAGGDA